jgi:hypothetical protein
LNLTAGMKMSHVHELTFDFRLYFVMLKKGTSPKVRTVPKRIPPMIPTKFSCQGIELIPNKQVIISNNFIKAK